MRVLMLLGWLLVPVLFGAYHFGPGQERLHMDNIALVLADADKLAEAGQWQAAVKRYEEAQGMIPSERVADARRVRLSIAKARMESGGLPQAHDDLKVLVEELTNDPKADPELLSQAREAQAASQYYLVWLMRLEGFTKEEWGPEVEEARQTYKLLAEQAQAKGAEKDARKQAENVESAIRLARIDLEELQGLPLPSQ